MAHDDACDVAADLTVLCAEMRAFLPAQRHHGAAERTLLRLVAGERRGEIAGGAQRAGEARGVERRLGDAGAEMGTRHEGGIAHERDAAERNARRFEIVDRLEEGSRDLEDAGKLRATSARAVARAAATSSGRISGGGMPAA